LVLVTTLYNTDKYSRRLLYSSNLFILDLGADYKIFTDKILLFLVVYPPNNLFSIPGLEFPNSSILDDRSAMFFSIVAFISSWVGPTSFH